MRKTIATLSVVAALLLGACGDDDGDESSDETVEQSDGGAGEDASDTDTDTDDGDSDAGGSGDSTMTFDGEEIALTARCYLEPQDAAGGGGQILINAQGSGTNAAGEDVLLDVTRFDEESMFSGDSVSVVIGPIATAATWDGNEGTFEVDGSTVSADAFVVSSMEATSAIESVEVSFELNC